MKKIFAFVLVLAMIFVFVACDNSPNNSTDSASESNTEKVDNQTETENEQTPIEEDGLMTYDEYAAASDDDAVKIEAYVQDKQIYSEQYGNTSLYLQDEDGAYFVYRWACTQAEYDALTIGVKVRVTGFKSSWAGEQEIIDAEVEVLSGNYIADATDVTALLGTDELINYQNRYVVFKGMTVEAYDESGAAFAYKSEDGSDIYYKVSLNGVTYNFCVESDLRGAGSEAYEAVKALKVGDVVDITGFLYWYNGANPHTTGVSSK